jgi:hypothetical protein
MALVGTGMNILDKDEAQKKRDMTIRSRQGVAPVQQGGGVGLGDALGMGAQVAGAIKPTGGNMAPVDRALEAQTNAQAFSRAQDQLQYLPPETQQTLGPLFAEASKRYNKRGVV